MPIGSDEDKTEEPTSHRIKKFKKKGNNYYSTEVNYFFLLFFSCFTFFIFRKTMFFSLLELLKNSLQINYSIIFSNTFFLKKIIFDIKKICLIFIVLFLEILLISYTFPLLLGGGKIHFRFFNFSLKKLNFINGIKKMFSFESIFELLKIILKSCLILGIFIYYFVSKKHELFFLSIERESNVFFHGFNILVNFIYIAILSYIPVVMLDFIWKKISFFKKLKMTQQEIKEELKDIEGNPHTKSRILHNMKLLSRKRNTIDIINKSDVVVTNPTHYAISIQYIAKKMKSPKITAKGIGVSALYIIKIAKKNNIPILYAPILARSLYYNFALNQFISPDFYSIIAEIITWSWNFNKWKKEGGKKPIIPKDLSEVLKSNIEKGKRKL
ncbi:EscU/YscU/HrcU family type III secretion system export apparatus switch protein [Buchnera aphidicola (Kurisakia onigurumii)]|uniref:EscU/YscU/HrcU family type III secretion system export apparatus switch protein n=1 Tax=Buchnera aphidicola TaxID=9 RepID=UPI0031B6A1D1